MMSATVETSLKQRICNSIEIPILTRCCFCFPLRKGLITFAYFNLILTLIVTGFLTYYISYLHTVEIPDPTSEYSRLIADGTGMILETIMSVVFLIALHKKHVLLMKVYLYFEIVFSIVGFIYSLAFLTSETGSEVFLLLFQLTLQMYLVILIWSSIVKMERDGAVKYTREVV